jgi:hypothetical protein
MSTPKIIQPVQSAAVSDSAERGASSAFDQAIQGSLGRKLRETYEEVVKEQVPDKFLELLSDLKRAEASKSSGTDAAAKTKKVNES